jgi:urease accessory protein
VHADGHALNIAGAGEIVLRRLNGRTVATTLRGNAPLKLLSPRPCGAAAWVVTSTYGGGLLLGDEISVDVDAGEGTVSLLGTQASTKIYRSRDGIGARQSLTANVAADALLVILPDPLTCFATAVFEQRQRIQLRGGGSLVMLDWMTSGRSACGERWDFSRCALRNDIFVGDRQVLAERLLLDSALGDSGGRFCTGNMGCLATLVLLGPKIHGQAVAILDWVGRQPIGPVAGVFFSASPLHDGVIIRAAGPDSETVGRWLRGRLAFLTELLGDDPWRRRY